MQAQNCFTLRFGPVRYALGGPIQAFPGLTLESPVTGIGDNANWGASLRFVPALYRLNSTAAIRAAPSVTLRGITMIDSNAQDVTSFLAHLRYRRDLHTRGYGVVLGAGGSAYGSASNLRLEGCSFLGVHAGVYGSAANRMHASSVHTDANFGFRIWNTGERPYLEHCVRKGFVNLGAPSTGSEVVEQAFSAGALSDDGSGNTKITLTTPLEWLTERSCNVDLVNMAGSTAMGRAPLVPVDNVQRISATEFRLLDDDTPVPWSADFALVSGTFKAWPDRNSHFRSIVAMTDYGDGTLQVEVDHDFPPMTDPLAANPNAPGWPFGLIPTAGGSETLRRSTRNVYQDVEIIDHHTLRFPSVTYDADMASWTGWVSIHPQLYVGENWADETKRAWGYHFENADGGYAHFCQSRNGCGFYIDAANWKLSAEAEFDSLGSESVAAPEPAPWMTYLYLGPGATNFDMMGGSLKDPVDYSLISNASTIEPNMFGVRFGSKVWLQTQQVRMIGCNLTDTIVEISAAANKLYLVGCYEVGMTAVGVDGETAPHNKIARTGYTRQSSGALESGVIAPRIRLQRVDANDDFVGGFNMLGDGGMVAGARALAATEVDVNGRGGRLSWQNAVGQTAVNMLIGGDDIEDSSAFVIGPTVAVLPDRKFLVGPAGGTSGKWELSYRNYYTTAAAGTLFEHNWKGKNDTGGTGINFIRQVVLADAVTAGAESGAVVWSVRNAGSLQERLRLTAAGVLFGGTVRLTLPGPYANDAAAAAAGVAVGEAYRVTGGTVAWRVS